MNNLADFDGVVADFMSDFGGVATLQIYSEGTYNTSTGKNTITKTDYLVNIILLDYTLQSNGLQSSPNSLIQTGDKQCYVQPRNKVSSSFVMPTVQPNRDRILIGNTVWKIVTLKEVDPSATGNNVLLELNLRK